MIVHYHEAAVVCHPGNPAGKLPTLEDHHKTAWQLFSGGDDYPGQARPFIFRADPLGNYQCLFLIRSAEPFENARPCQLVLEEGAELALEWVMVPTLSTRLGPQGERLPRSRRIVAPQERWREVAQARIERHGFRVQEDTLKALPLGQVKHHRHRAGQAELMMGSAKLLVTNPLSAASAWLDGVAKMRAYGMGMLCRVR